MSDATTVLALVRAEIRAMRAYEVPHPRDIVAKLDANESPFDLPEDHKRALFAELSRVPLNRYPGADCGELRAAVAADLGVAPESLVFGNGSDELIALLVTAFDRRRAGADRAAVLYPVPSFAVYRIASDAAGARPVEVPLADDFGLDEPAVDAALDEHRPNLAFFARPNNPTGSLWSRAAIERWARERPDMLVVVDEAYIDYGGDSMLPLAGDRDNVVVMRTLSKLGLAALRVGFAIAPPAVRHELEKVRPPYNLGELNQRAATYALTRCRDVIRDGCRAVIAERARVAAGLAELSGIRVFDSAANLLLFAVDGDGPEPATEVWRALVDRGVLVRKFGAGRLGGCLRVTIGTADENTRFLAAMREIAG